MTSRHLRPLMLTLFLVSSPLFTACAATTAMSPAAPAVDVRAAYPKPDPAPPLSAATASLLEGESPEISAAFGRLRDAEEFQTEAVSYDGHVSDNVAAFRVLRRSPSAPELFAALGRESTTVGMLYAAVGLRDLDSEEFQRTVVALGPRSHQRVTLQVGCMTLTESVKELLKADKDGIVLAPGQSLMEWLSVHKTGHLDIVGGGYTAAFTSERNGAER